MPRSCLAHTLLFLLHLANAAVAGAAGRWLAGLGALEARHLSRVGCGQGKVNDDLLLSFLSNLTHAPPVPARPLPYPFSSTQQ